MGRTAGLVGAALAVVDELFAPEYLRTWIDHGSPAHHPEPAAASAPRRDAGGGARPGRRSAAPRAEAPHTVERIGG